MKSQNNMWSIVLILSGIALLVLGSMLVSFNIYDMLYFCFLVYAIFRFIYLRKSKQGLN